ncbi:MAG TPA: class I SAM-dependent methyltransferase [Vicinamibacteria bacterium]|nr:class I SAM-dependent methyltransferase [Vicinamibacteria bacterium]
MTFDQEWRARFQRFGSSYEAEHAVSGWSVEGLERRLELFRGLLGGLSIPARAHVLELGCGAGTYVRYLSRLGHRAIGVDYAVPSLIRAVTRDPGQSGKYLAADGYELPFRHGTFDLVVCIGVLQALGEPERLLREVARALKPGGILVVEALNAVALPAGVRRLREIAARRPARLRFYRVGVVEGWLRRSGLAPRQRAGVYLAPRRYPRIGRAMGAPVVARLLESVPGASRLSAHAFWVVAERGGAAARLEPVSMEHGR